MRETSLNIWKRPDYRSKLVEIHKNYILNNPDKILTSVHGVFRSDRLSIDIHYDSSWEKKFLEFCERNSNVIISYDRAYLDIPYVYQDEEHTFFPDFKVCLNNGKTLLVEIKAKWLIEHQPKIWRNLNMGRNLSVIQALLISLRYLLTMNYFTLQTINNLKKTI